MKQMKRLEKPNWRKKRERQKKFLLVLLFAFLLIPLFVGVYFLSANLFSGEKIETSGATIFVKSGGNLQAALDRAKSGDTIVLEAGAKFVGSFTLPNKTGAEFITIQSSELAKLPKDGVRVSPKDAALMPKILSSGKNEPALKTAAGAHHYRFIGIEFSVNKPEDDVWKLILVGDDVQSRIEQVPHHIAFDRCYVHGHPAQTGIVRSGFSINGANIEITNSHISDFRLKGDEAQAIVAWNAPGPFRIINNRIESGGENVLFGGAFAHKGMNPSNLEFRRNYVTRPLEWRSKYVIKNLFELKDMSGAIIEENIFEHNWSSGQDGTAIVLTPASFESGPDARVENIVFRSNIIRRTANAISMTGTDYGDKRYPNVPVQNKNVRFENNLFEDISKKWSDGGNGGRFLLLTSGAGPDDLTFNHNTIQNSGTLINLDGGPTNNFIFTNNIGFHNDYGIIAGGKLGDGIGSNVLKLYMKRLTFRKNIIVGADSKRYPTENFYPTEMPGVNSLKGKATDGKSVGADLIFLGDMEKKVVAGVN